MARPPAPMISYRLLSGLLLPFWIGHAVWQALQYRCRQYFFQRLGFFKTDIPRQAIWIHAASVGEVELIRPLAQTLAQQYPVVVSCFTITGYQHARKTLAKNIDVIALAIDCWPISRAFIQRLDFRLALIAETELWPETLYQTRRRSVPLLQINARLSHKSLSASGWKRAILQRTLGYFDRFLTRNDNDIKHLKAMGVPAQRISLCGNLKYASTEVHREKPGRLIDRPYILFASTHSPEERRFAALIAQLDTPPLFVIAPRHPKRAVEILKALKPLGLSICQRSKGETLSSDTDIYLADTLGEMQPLMAHARIIVMGGSFNAVGGHNILEPAKLAGAIITGPSDDNIRSDIQVLQQQQAIIQVHDIEQLRETIKRLLNDEQALQALRKNARKAMQQQSQVLNCYLDEIGQVISAQTASL